LFVSATILVNKAEWSA